MIGRVSITQWEKRKHRKVNNFYFLSFLFLFNVMLPNSDEKAKQSFLKKRSFSLLNKRHSRSQSSSSSAPNHEPLQTIPSSFNLENNKRGWLESMPVQVTPSRSLDTRSTYATKSTATRHHASKSKDIGKGSK